MPEYDGNLTPQLRFVEAHPADLDGGQGFMLHDPSGLAAASITVSEPALFILSKFDGSTTLDEVRRAFVVQFGQPIGEDQIAELVDGLRQVRLLDGEEFEKFHEGLVAEYRASATRPMLSADALGLVENPQAAIKAVLDTEPTQKPPTGRIVGLIAPHLDYPRGGVCYSAAYTAVADMPAPRRVVILGTNHFGRGLSVVATGKDFETPLGVTKCDVDFLNALEARCGDLRTHEFDHYREHSIELQLLICQHLWGADAFEFVPVLCPDPCGPTGTAPFDGEGVDLRKFAAALRELIADEGTLVIAGADLSHIGPQFGDSVPVNGDFRAAVHQRDRAALAHVSANKPDDFVLAVAEGENPTRVCSAGCIATALWALPDAEVHLLRYHQAVDEAEQVGVTCAAAVLTV